MRNVIFRFVLLGLPFFISIFSSPINAQDLYLTWVGVVDNGEGDDWPHGPLGNLHLVLYNAQGKEYSHTILTGPSNNEFKDGDQASYSAYLGWGTYSQPIFVKIYESDPGGKWLGRSHDVLFEAWVTKPGLWYSGLAAPADARRNAIRRGANNWAREVWNGGIRSGIPKIFLEIVAQ